MISMPKINFNITKIFEKEVGVQAIEDELNRVVNMVEGEIVSVQVEKAQEGNYYRLYITTK